MASLLADVDAVKSAVSSVSTCSSATIVTLKGLLLPRDDTSSKSTRPGKQNAPGPAKAPRKTKVAGGVTKDELSVRDRAALATQVVNSALRALGDAAKPVPQTPSKKQDDVGLVKTATRNALRRSNSAPMTPLQPRSLNRISTSPVKTARPVSTASSTSIVCLSTVECARVAFCALRILHGSGKITLPELQLEAGMSSFAAKLISLGLHDQALKELRILKQRLDGGVVAETTKPPLNENKTSTNGLAELLDFRRAKASEPAMSLIVTTQIQILKILSAMKKPALIAAALPVLRMNHPSSVINFLLSMAKQNGADRAKLARQMETVSQSLLSLTPSVSSSQDGIAADARFSVSPEIALELQSLGLKSRLLWWRLAGHQGDIEKDIMSPLSRCLGAFLRRSKGRASAYQQCMTTVNDLHELVPTASQPALASSKSPQSTIYQMLATLARESGNLEDAVQWAMKLRDSAEPKTESAAKLCSLAAQLLAFQLKLDPAKHLEDATLLNEVLSGVQGSLRGDTTELDELLGNVAILRRAIIAVLLGHVKDAKCAVVRPPPSAKESLETFVLQCPRFCLRWLGKPPIPTSSTKDYLRYEQRRQLLLQSIHHTLDSAFMLAKTLLDEQRLGWDVLETMLADSLMLLEYMGELPMPEDATSYYVKISHFYYMKYNSLRQDQSGSRTDSGALKALRRSIDCVKDRPAKERERAQLILKFERMAELCRSLGRADEALGALQGIRNCLVQDGNLAAVAAALETQHPQVAWSLSYDVDVLCRTLSSIARIEATWTDWTVNFPEAEQAAALEHRLHFVLLGSEKRSQTVTLDDPTVDALLRIYIPTRFPIRRLRTLLRLLSAAVGDNDLLSRIRFIAADAVQLDQDNLGEDVPLAQYLPHMKALFDSITSLVDGYSDPRVLEQTLSVWRTMVDTHPTKEGLADCIDGVADLLSHLESVAEFLRLKGHQNLLDTVVRLAADISGAAEGPRPEQFVHTHTALALHLTDVGSSIQAARIFERAEGFVGQSEDTPGYLAAELQLANADFLITTGNAGKASEHIAKAATSFASNQSTHRIPRLRKKMLFAYASYLRGVVALNLGNSHHALAYCRESVRVLFSEWTGMESQLTGNKDKKTATADDSTALVDISAAEATNTTTTMVAAPDFWICFRHLFGTLLQLSTIYSHLGMFQETIYYAEQAEKMARATESGYHIVQATAWLSSVYLKAGKLEKSREFVDQAKHGLQAGYRSCPSVSLLCQMASIYRGLHDFNAESEMVAMAEDILAVLNSKTPPFEPAANIVDTTDIEKKMAKLDIKEKPAVRPTRRTAKQQPVRKAASTAKPAKLKATAQALTTTLPTEDPCLSIFRASVMIQKAISLLGRKDWAAATSVLRDIVVLPKHLPDFENKHIVIAACLLGQSLEGMARDSVFSVVNDSTLSFPTLAVSHADRLSLSKTSPPRKGRGAATANRKDTLKDSVAAGFLLSLLEAQDMLLEAHGEVALTGDGSLLHRISSMLQTVTLVLSTISDKSKPVNHIGHAASSADLARNLTWRRERKALLQEKHATKSDGSGWPAVLCSPEDSRRTSLGPSTDLHKFQRDYIDIIPKTWTAISISLSENKHDLCITRLQAGQSPFVIRLPLARASSRDADTEVLDFQQGRAELLEIVRLANETCHDARDMAVKGAKAAWWADREALDNRMKDLLEDIERDWLGGFRGIFSQHQRRPDLLARFQKSFQNMLDKHLPSRRQVRGKKTRGAGAAGGPAAASKITLDPRILELFIGLGDATVEGCDFDDALTDLLYFVVDILQFHGERNAYDEVDLDAMVVETFDALHAYHAAAKATADATASAGVHTILVLDKALHAFPWESLPCMQGNAVSRVPSLACLRRLIVEAQPPASSGPSADLSSAASHPAGHHIPPTSGTYILNPSSDLKSTQATFSAPLQAHLPSWTSIVSRPPTEAEFSAALASSPVLLYFGHGSGAQYVRGRTVRRLDPGCRAAALLWGCSSAALADCGGFEAHGPAWNYLMAGCPAVAGTLWDVTDRDIDRFAARALEAWGLVPRGAVVVAEQGGGGKAAARARGRGPEREKAAARGESGGGGGTRDHAGAAPTSLVQAISCARESACRFRYLTAAAVVVYGIPVYIDK